MSNRPNVTVQGDNRVSSLRNYLNTDTVRGEIINALPRILNPNRVLRQVMTLVQNTPSLLECTQKSILVALIQASELGLELSGPLGHAYLVPYKNKGVSEAHFQVGYRGLIVLAFRSGQVASFSLQTVCENDDFTYELGTTPRIYHRPADGKRGQPTHYYAVCNLKGGGTDFEVMSKEDVITHRDRYARGASRSDSPWQTAFDAMACKTVARKLAKRLPLSADFQEAALRDEYNEVGVPTPAPSVLPAQPGARTALLEERLAGTAALDSQFDVGPDHNGIDEPPPVS